MCPDDLRRFVIKQLAGDIVFSESKRGFELSLKTVTATLRSNVVAEAAKWGFNESQADALINKVLFEMQGINMPNYKDMQYVDLLRHLRLGDELLMRGSDPESGMATMRLLFVGTMDDASLGFLCLESSRGFILPGDVVSPADDTLWSVGFPIRLRIMRQGSPYPSSDLIYRSYRLSELSLRIPSVIHQTIDSKRDFSFQEHSVLALTGVSLSWCRNPMSILLHDYSSLFPVYADFDEDGVGVYSSNPDVVMDSGKARNAIFGIDGKKNELLPLKISTTVPGKVVIDKKNNRLAVLESAKSKVQPIAKL